MATSQMNEVLQHLRKAMLWDGAGLTDGQLLAGYVSGRDEAALAALVRRHGPMVWGVCRRVLGNWHDAEDAFQATFLVLVRKAASIASRELLAGWLYGVAHQTALNARTTTARRRVRERQVTQMPEASSQGSGVRDQEWHELQARLDQELSRLPDKYRLPILLCDLEGRTRQEAARQLGCPPGTVAGRLARARVMLAQRLARRGLAVSGGALAALLSQHAASASVPAALVGSTITAARLFAAGQATALGVNSTKAVALAEGVLKAMLLTKLKMGAALLLALAAVSLGALGRLSTDVRAAQEEARKSPVAAVASAGAAQAEAKKKPVGDETQNALTAKQILGRMAKAYATCKSYRDSGTVKTDFIEANGTRTVELPFTTAFVRPDRFRFEYRDKQVDNEEICYVVWRRGKNVQTWWDIKPGVETPNSLGLALAGATGVSGGSAHTIPALLLPEEVGGRLTEITDAKRIDDAKLGKAYCFRMQGTYGASPLTLWIDKKTSLVRRIDTQNKFANFRTEQTTTYDPLIDTEITDKMLEFNVAKPK